MANNPWSVVVASYELVWPRYGQALLDGALGLVYSDTQADDGI